MGKAASVDHPPRDNKYGRNFRKFARDRENIEAIVRPLSAKDRLGYLSRPLLLWVCHMIHCIICGTYHKTIESHMIASRKTTQYQENHVISGKCPSRRTRLSCYRRKAGGDRWFVISGPWSEPPEVSGGFFDLGSWIGDLAEARTE